MKNHAYDESAALAKKIGGLMMKVGKRGEFDAWIAGVREKHNAKRNFMKRLESVAAGRGKQQ
jgi:hypothetical protein